MATEQATFAAGCFWGVEDTFRQVPGVVDVRVGYTGGSTENPTYREICGGGTGHAEAVSVTFDPERVSYDDLLGVFWGCHDPTQVNRQGPDVGTNYRSAIFYRDQQQLAAAAASKESQQDHHRRPIATEIAAAETFWDAEEYHQRYFEKNGISSCRI